jgi:hypothetical protein
MNYPIAILVVVAMASSALAQERAEEPTSQPGVLRPADSTPPVNLPRIVPLPDPKPIQVDRVSPVSDFTLPYVCCSDCPEPASTDPRIELARDQYCTDDDTPYPLTGQPGDSTISGPGTKPQDSETGAPEPVEVDSDRLGQPALPH